jgi:cysteine desulfuration protein SufE
VDIFAERFCCEKAGTCSVAETIDQIIDEFAELEDWEERYEYILEQGEQLRDFPDEYRTEEHEVDGCLSTVWMVAAVQPGDRPVMFILADSDSHFVRGLVAILLRVFCHQSAEEILACDIHCLFDRLELGRHLSANRRNGLRAMVNRIRALAQEHV